MSQSVQAPRVLNIEDLRRAAKRRLPRVVFDYIDGGAEDEWTLRANSRAFEAVTLRPRCAVAVPSCDLRTVVLGASRSEEHTSELQSQSNLVCRLLLEKKKSTHSRSPSAASKRN